MSHDWIIIFTTIWATWLFFASRVDLGLSERFPQIFFAPAKKTSSKVFMFFRIFLWIGFAASVENFFLHRLGNFLIQLQHISTWCSSFSLTEACICLLSATESHWEQNTAEDWRTGKGKGCLHKGSLHRHVYCLMKWEQRTEHSWEKQTKALILSC